VDAYLSLIPPVCFSGCDSSHEIGSLYEYSPPSILGQYNIFPFQFDFERH
jgi:hypothetical protein